MNFINICINIESEVVLLMNNLIDYVFLNFGIMGIKFLLWKIFFNYENLIYLLVE